MALTNTSGTERKMVAALFILVLIIFSLAQHDAKRFARPYSYTIEKAATVATAKNAPAMLP